MKEVKELSRIFFPMPILLLFYLVNFCLCYALFLKKDSLHHQRGKMSFFAYRQIFIEGKSYDPQTEQKGKFHWNWFLINLMA